MNRLRLDLPGPVKLEVLLQCVGLTQAHVCLASVPRVQARRDMLKITPLAGEPNM